MRLGEGSTLLRFVFFGGCVFGIFLDLLEGIFLKEIDFHVFLRCFCMFFLGCLTFWKA